MLQLRLFLTVAITALGNQVFAQSFLIGDRADVYGADGKYYAASILEKSGAQVKVHYFGTTAESDAWVKNENLVRGGAKGDKIIVVAASGTFYGTIEEVLINDYKVKYDGYPQSYTLTRSQFNFISSEAESRKNNAQTKQVAPVTVTTEKKAETTKGGVVNGIYQPGTKLMGLEGKTWYAATIKEFANGKYLVNWDGYNTEAWLTPDQLKPFPKLPADKSGLVNGKVYVRSMLWIATGNTELSWFFLGDNGIIIINPLFGTNPANPALEQTDNYKNIGIYTMGTNTLNVKWLNGTSTSYPLKMKGGEISELDAGGIMVRQKGLAENYKLNGTYKGSISFGAVSSSATYTFRNDGTLNVSYMGIAGQGRSEISKQGKYQIKGCNLKMMFNDGTTTNANIGTADGTGNTNIIVNNTWLTKM